MSRLRTTAARLQQALNTQGQNISLNSRQFYSTKYGKIVTCYKIHEERELIAKTYSIAEVVRILAEMYGEVSASGADSKADEICGGLLKKRQPDAGRD